MSAITDSPSRRRRDSWVANPPAKASVGSTKSVCVIGAGHVGAPHAIMMAKKCPSVKFTVVDDDERRVAAFKSSSLLPFYEPGMAETLDDVKGTNLFFSTDFDGAVRDADMVFVSVSTPLKDSGSGAGFAPDLVHWETMARRIAKAAGGPKVIVERSTVPATAGKSMAKILKANSPHAMVVLSNPEFAREGNAMVDHASPERVLIGGPETEAGLAAIEQLAALYCQWVPRDKVITSSLWSAELSKLTQNAFLAQRVSSINAISALCEATGADVDEVSFAVGVDTRIGRKGMTASVGFGGACYETHLRNLVYLASVSRLPQVAKYWQAVINMNEWQKRRFATKVVSAMFNTVSGKKLALLGFAYKKNTSDTRNSAAIDVCRALLTERAQIAVHDPRVAKEAIAVALSDADGAERLLAVEADPYVAIDGSHALLVMTEWDEFKRLDYKRAFSMMQKPAFVFDGRNLLDHAALREIGFIVHGIGKAQPRGPAPKPLIAGGSIGESSPGAPKPAAAAKPAPPLRMDTMGGGA